MDGLEIRELSFIPPSENIGRLNPLNVVAGDASKRNESAESPLLVVFIIFKILLSHQYARSLAELLVGLKQLNAALL